MTPEDKIVEAINHQTNYLMEEEDDPLLDVAKEILEQLKSLFIIAVTGIICLLIAFAFFAMFGIKARAAPLLSDGDETASVGTVQTITPHPAWAAPIGGSQWISIAQTGWPLATRLPNGTVVSFSEVFSLDSIPSSAMVTWAADDSAALYINGQLAVPEASMVGNGYSTCSDTAPTCNAHTVTDILPWLVAGENVIRFDVAQRGGWSYGLNYAVSLGWLDEPPLPTPEPGTWLMVMSMLLMMGCAYYLRILLHRACRKVVYLADAIAHIRDTTTDEDSKAIARKAREE